MYKNKYFIAAIFLALVLAGIIGLAASYAINQNNKNGQPSPITINMIGYTYSEEQMQPLVQQYEKTHPLISVNYKQIGQNGYSDYLLQRFHSGNQSIIPDIFEATSTDQNTFLKYSKLAPTNIINAQTFKNTYYNLYQRGLVYANKYVLGLPLDMDPLILLYNKDLANSSGYNMSAIASDFDMFNSTVADFAKKHTKTSSINIGIPTNISVASDILQLFMIENGTTMNTSDGYKAAFNTTQGAQALQYYNSFISGDFKANWSYNSPEDDANIFAHGKSLMLFAYPEDIAVIKQINPAINLGYTTYPTLTTPVTLAHYNYLGVYGKTQNPTTAWDFANFISQKASLATLNASTVTTNPYTLIPPRKDMTLTLSDSSLAAALTQAENIAADWNTQDRTKTTQAFTKMITDYYTTKDAQDTLNLGVKSINNLIQNSFAL